MSRPLSLTVSGLFGHLDHKIAFRTDERVTIVTGPNGSGKTHVLNLLKALVALDFTSIFGMPLAEAVVAFDDGKRLRIKLDEAHENLDVTGYVGRSKLGAAHLNRAETSAALPPWLEPLSGDRWFDSREGRTISGEFIERRYGVRIHRANKFANDHPWLAEFRSEANPIMIATGRLDVLIDRDEYRRDVKRRPEAVARIVQYAESIQSQVNEARRASLAQSQRSDRGFAVRALDKARATVKESELRKRYADISALNQELHTNGLTEETVAVVIPPGRTNPTERRILNLFLDDWQEKLAPLLPIHQKLQLLKEIVGTKLYPKKLFIGGQGELLIVSPTGEQIAVELLSSGEQHLLALYSMLLFTAEEGGLVLVDEPEISLHASWKHAFLADMERVAVMNRFNVVMATHSTGIINGRWELVEEIGGEN